MRIVATALAAGMLMLAGCKAGNPVQNATGKVATFHQRLDAGDYAAIYREAAPEITRNASEAQFAKLLGAVHDKLGKVRESKQIGWNAQVGTGGDVAELTMDTKFERGQGQEHFVFKGAGDEQKLAGYQVNSDALLTN